MIECFKKLKWIRVKVTVNFKLVDQDGWSVQSGSKYDDICSHDRSSVLVQSKKTTIILADTPTSTLGLITRLAVLQG